MSSLQAEGSKGALGSPGAPLSVVFVGALSAGQHSEARARAFERLGHRVIRLDAHLEPPEAASGHRLWAAIRRRSLWPLDEAHLASRLVRAVRDDQPDLVWLEKALTLGPATLRAVRRHRPGIRVVAFLPDTLRHWGQVSLPLIGQLRHCDAVATPNPRAQRDLRRLRCRVVPAEKAYDRDLHRPLELTADERLALGAPVGFVGHWERPRAQILERLHRDAIPLAIWGQQWARHTRGRPLAAAVRGGPKFGIDYARILNAFDIGLCFLRRKAGDRVTSRSIEIPACGVFMLAERTDEHRALFDEGREAEFFSSYGELRDKIRHYLAHPAERETIAAAGRRRCVQSGYHHEGRLGRLLDRLMSRDSPRGPGPAPP